MTALGNVARHGTGANACRMPRLEPRNDYCCCCCCAVDVVFEACSALRAASSALYSSFDRSYQPIHEKPISSIVRPVPAPTQFRGSGLNLLAGVLSYHVITWSSVPAGTIGATSSW